MKNNLGKKPDGIGFRIQVRDIGNGIEAPYVEWDGEPVNYTADQALAASQDQDAHNALHQAKDFLKERLADGPMASAAVITAAEAYAISERTLKRAARALGIKPEKTGFKGGWQWSLPK